MTKKDVRVMMSYRDLDLARAEFKGLVKLARSFKALSVPASVNHGVLNFRYDNWNNAYDFYKTAFDEFHFSSGELR